MALLEESPGHHPVEPEGILICPRSSGIRDAWNPWFLSLKEEKYVIPLPLPVEGMGQREENLTLIKCQSQ